MDALFSNAVGVRAGAPCTELEFCRNVFPHFCPLFDAIKSQIKVIMATKLWNLLSDDPSKVKYSI